MTTEPSSHTKQDNGARPKGRDEVAAAFVEAASRLFGEKGPDAVSIRDVAAAANVNHGLAHRHFGSKEALLLAVLSEQAHAFQDAASHESDPVMLAMKLYGVLENNPAFWRVLAHILVVGRTGEELVAHKGGLSQLAELCVAARPDASAPDVKLNIALAAAMGYGWLLFGAFIERVLGETFDPTAVKARLVEAFASMLESV